MDEAAPGRCLVTGATGLLGTNLVHALVREGWHVRALGLPGSPTRWIEQLPVETVFGDVTDAQDMHTHTADVDVVFNVAGDTSWWRRLHDRQRRVNVEGPATVAEACLRNGVRRLVHTSTADVLGVLEPGEQARTEADRYNLAGTGYHYGDTKLAGDERLRTFADRLEIVWIHPGAMLGPFDFTLQYGRIFAELRDGKIPGVPVGGASWAHVSDVADAHVAAATRGRPGEGYICAGVNATYREVFELMAARVGGRAPRRTIPPWAFTLYGHVLQAGAEFTRRPPQVDPGYARFMSRRGYYDSAKAVKELDYRVRPLEQLVDDAYDWLVANALL